MTISIPEFSLVLLVGPSASGKSTFAARHFAETEVISSDRCRAMIDDDENSHDATPEAFDLLRTIAAKRLARRRLTVIDATNVRRDDRRLLVELARTYHCFAVAILFDLPEETLFERNKNRSDRSLSKGVIVRQKREMGRSLRRLKKEGIRFAYRLATPDEVEAVTIERQKLWTDRRDESGPFDIIGDVHGCCDELEALLDRLGYEREEVEREKGDTNFVGYPALYRHPAGRRAIFLGDLVDRGPRNLDALFLAQTMVEAGTAICVPGNHDVKFLRKLRGKNVAVRHGLEKTLAEVEALSEDDRTAATEQMILFIDSLVSHYELDGGNLVVAHAGMKETMQGRSSGAVREFALYGETTGETDEFGLPVRFDWASEYRGESRVVYGHTPVPEAPWLNRTINIDTGAVFGGRLTALRYPELELVDVPAAETYADPIRPIVPVEESASTAQQEQDSLLEVEDVAGRRIVETSLLGRVTIHPGNSAAALEVASRFAVDPRLLIYLPPTMSPVATGGVEGYLERPEAAFSYYGKQGITRVVCEEKHMGSRAVVVVARTPAALALRFGIERKAGGVITTRTGRPFFRDNDVEAALLDHVRTALTANRFWQEFDTDWACFDCELMPWSEKAQVLLRDQYAAVGAAAEASLRTATRLLEQAAESGLPVDHLQRETAERTEAVALYRDAYRRYCWRVTGVNDLRLAPFHLMATEGKVHADTDHVRQMETIRRFFEGMPTYHPTDYLVVDTAESDSVAAGVAWWEERTSNGSEGMVVKPYDFVPSGPEQRLKTQPAVKVRGREYLRIIYGPEYTRPDNLERLRERNLSRKRSLALREFALGLEALDRFVGRLPLREVHAAVTGVLALESEPVDPRL